ncbi:MAG: hypothetical protein KC466_10315 [Myxococcales bacterium]|nr:hypothetical protein [Myxococcales bacterium]
MDIGSMEFLSSVAQWALDLVVIGLVGHALVRDRRTRKLMASEREQLEALAEALRELVREGEATSRAVSEIVDANGARLRKLLKASERERGQLASVLEAVESKRIEGVTSASAKSGGDPSELYMKAAKLLLGGEDEGRVASAMGIAERELKQIRGLQRVAAATSPAPARSQSVKAES